LRIGFVTCVQLGLSCMDEIYAAGGSLALALTLQDDQATGKSGRVLIDKFCREHSIRLEKIRNINDPAAVKAIQAHDLDWLCIIGWSQIAHREVLASAHRGALGMHPTLLPEGRGRASIPWAILKQLPRTGVTLFQLSEGVDAGPILAQEIIPLSPEETATTLYARVSDAHRLLIRRAWPQLLSNRLEPQPQDESRATVWPGRTPADGRLDPAMTVREAGRLVRATTHPYPGAFIVDEGKVCRVWQGKAADPSRPTERGSRRLRFSDGVYDAVSWEIE
jgi:methionyl-tRNA formyltransferase